jgi:hypothetical protein
VEPGVLPELDYEPAKQVLRRRRWRRAVVALIVLVGGIALWRVGPPCFRQARYVYWQSQCMSFTKPADFVAYEEAVTRASALLSHAGYQVVTPAGAPGAVGFIPPPLARLKSGWVSMAFVHGRTTPSGRRRLVVLGYQFEGQILHSGTLTGRVMRIYGSGKVPATLLPGSEVQGYAHNRLVLPLQPSDQLRLFWGQPDPDHADHFTVGYDLNGQRGTIDGWLKDDGQLDLKVRDGPATKIAAMLPY